MTPEDTSSIYNVTEIDDVTFAAIVKKRYNESDGHWNSQKKDNQNRRLKEIRNDNRKNYLSQYIEEQLIDDRYEEVFNDNRQFVAVETMAPFATGQVAAPEVTPANGDDLSKLFASDFEKALQYIADDEMTKYKIRLNVRDILVGERVGIGKFRYDAKLDTIVYDHLEPGSVVIGKRSKLFQEPDFMRQLLPKTPGDLIEQFPDKKDMILNLFGVEDDPDTLDETEYDINEDWIWLRLDGEKTLIVGWSYKDTVFGKIKDPNWDLGGKNLSKMHMMPFVFFNLINDGSGYIDQTSLSEQSKYSQKQYNKRGQVIAESARYGGTGVPIFAKGSITQKDAAKVHFSPVQRILLDSADVNKSFTTWQQTNLPSFIVEDKQDLKAAVDDTYGINSISRGQQSDNKTATQDVLLRNQAEGRMANILDMIEVGMNRFYKILGQMIWIYFDDQHLFPFMGNDGEFVSIVIKHQDIAKNLGIQIRVKAGTSLPLDRAQKRATILQLARLDKIGTLTMYRELGLFDDPEKAFKEYVEEQVNAMQLVQEADDDNFDRDANQDLVDVIGGKMPAERDDIGPEYVSFLNEWLLTDKFKLLQEKKPQVAARVSDWIDTIIAKAQRKADKLTMQPSPTPPPGGMPIAPPMMPGQPSAPQAPPQGPPQGATPPVTQAPIQPPTNSGSALPSAQMNVQ